jgi:hypothetical protein
MPVRPLCRMAVALVGGVLLAPPARAGADANPPPWGVTETPNQGTGPNTLHGVTALSPTEAWAVGALSPPVEGPYAGRALGRAGLGHRAQPEPEGGRRRPARGGGWHHSRRCVGGRERPADLGGDPDAHRALGRQRLDHRVQPEQWQPQPTPRCRRRVRHRGLGGGEGSTGSLILRWNGSDWSAVSNPCPLPLFGITAVAAADVWAVGDQDTCHWDGRAWSKVPGAPSFGDIFLLRDVSGAAADVVWAVGGLWSCPYDCIGYGLIERWDGTRWTAARFPDVVFSGVVAISRTEAYAMGQDRCGRTLACGGRGLVDAGPQPPDPRLPPGWRRPPGATCGRWARVPERPAGHPRRARPLADLRRRDRRHPRRRGHGVMVRSGVRLHPVRALRRLRGGGAHP